MAVRTGKCHFDRATHIHQPSRGGYLLGGTAYWWKPIAIGVRDLGFGLAVNLRFGIPDQHKRYSDWRGRNRRPGTAAFDGARRGGHRINTISLDIGPPQMNAIGAYSEFSMVVFPVKTHFALADHWSTWK